MMAQRLRRSDRPAAYNPFGKKTWRILYQAPDTGKVNRINREDTELSAVSSQLLDQLRLWRQVFSRAGCLSRRLL